MTYHVPVLLDASVDAILTRTDGIYIDGTMGGGGHTREILNRLDENGRLFAIDQDTDAIAEVQLLTDPRLTVVYGNFVQMADLTEQPPGSVDGILLDLGVSSHQLDEDTRGFSFRGDARLDMRMNPHMSTTAYEVVNQYTEADLRRILFEYGEERASRKIARRIVEARQPNGIETTGQLQGVIAGCVRQTDLTKVCARVFQAIRIEVNQELDVLREALASAFQLLRDQGTLAVISYHSLEDRITKQFIKSKPEREYDPDRPLMETVHDAWLMATPRKAITPGPDEIAANPRSRSAKLRIARKHIRSAS